MAGGRRRRPVCQQSEVSHRSPGRTGRSTVVRFKLLNFYEPLIKCWVITVRRLCRDGGLKRAKVKNTFKEWEQKKYSDMVVGDDSSSNSDWDNGAAPAPVWRMYCTLEAGLLHLEATVPHRKQTLTTLVQPRGGECNIEFDSKRQCDVWMFMVWNVCEPQAGVVYVSNHIHSFFLLNKCYFTNLIPGAEQTWRLCRYWPLSKDERKRFDT